MTMNFLGKSFASTYCFKSGVRLNSCAMVQICLLFNSFPILWKIRIVDIGPNFGVTLLVLSFSILGESIPRILVLAILVTHP
jgi:hypothetical protein